MGLTGDLLGGWLAKLAIPILLIAAISGWGMSKYHQYKASSFEKQLAEVRENYDRCQQWVMTYEQTKTNADEQVRFQQEQLERLRNYERNKPKPNPEDNSEVDQSYVDSLFGGLRLNKTPANNNSKPSGKGGAP